MAKEKNAILAVQDYCTFYEDVIHFASLLKIPYDYLSTKLTAIMYRWESIQAIFVFPSQNNNIVRCAFGVLQAM
jgi:hypothetical protein